MLALAGVALGRRGEALAERRAHVARVHCELDLVLPAQRRALIEHLRVQDPPRRSAQLVRLARHVKGEVGPRQVDVRTVHRGREERRWQVLRVLVRRDRLHPLERVRAHLDARLVDGGDDDVNVRNLAAMTAQDV
eukprot:7380936-Prymnesium_polylepis.1